MSGGIHPLAWVDPSAVLADGVTVGPFARIGAEVVIGEGTEVASGAQIQGPTRIGSSNRIHPHACVGTDPQDLKFAGERVCLEIGDRNQIREHVTIHRGTRVGGGITRVGSDNLIMVAAHIAHDCIVGSHCVIANQVMVGGHAVIEDCANIGGGAGIHHFTTVGTMSFVGGLCRVKKDVPPYMKVEGDPVEVRGVNTIALTRRAYSEHEINALKEAYKRLFLHPRSATAANGHRLTGAQREAARSVAMSDRIDELLREYPQFPTVVRLCQSLRDAAGGVHGRSRELAREDSKYATPVK